MGAARRGDDLSTGADSLERAALLDGLRQIALAVAIVSARHGERSSFSTGTLTYVSVDPVMIVTPLVPTSRTLSVMRAAGAFSVTLLGRESRGLATVAGTSSTAPNKFASLGVDARDGPGGRIAPVDEGALAVLWCSLVDELRTGDHVCCVGLVEGAALPFESVAGPLVRFRRDYCGLDAPRGPADDSPYPI